MDEQTHQQPNWFVVTTIEEPKKWLAIASFVLSLLGLNILWLIFGIIALKRKQLKRAAMAWTIISAVELFIVIICIPRFLSAWNMANDMERQKNVEHLGICLTQYALDNDWYPKDLTDLMWYKWCFVREKHVKKDHDEYPYMKAYMKDYPTKWDTYGYIQLNNGSRNWSNCMVYTDLSCKDCGNCDSSKISEIKDFNSARNVFTKSWDYYCDVQ